VYVGIACMGVSGEAKPTVSRHRKGDKFYICNYTCHKQFLLWMFSAIFLDN